MKCLVLVIYFIGLSRADEDYENKLTKLWSLSSASSSDGSAVLNVTSASILIQPTSYSDPSVRTSRDSKLPYYKKYSFKPRAIPIRNDQIQKTESYYQNEKYKPEVLFPGNYMPIAKVKKNDTDYSIGGEPFRPKPIPLVREQEFQRRSLDVDEEPIIEKPAGFTEAVASRRSISDILGVEEEDDYQNEEEEEEEEDLDQKGPHVLHHVNKIKKKAAKKAGKLTKYMLPLLMAYKLKYFALVPLLIGGLVLLVGATGLAGFFFALFAAVMGLQKGGY